MSPSSISKLHSSSFVCAALIAISACGRAASTGDTAAKRSTTGTASSGSGVETNCTPWATFAEGPYKYENNIWGSNKAKGAFEQCLLRREKDIGWRWSWPGFDPSVFAYPQILFGWKPWSGGTPTDARFPLRVADVKHLVLEYEVETEATGSYNLAPEVWLIREGGGTRQANPRLITTEVMFWMDYASGARPAGTIVDTPTLDGVKYELWKEDNIGDRGDGTGWMLLSFKSPTIQRQGRISIHRLLAHLVEAKLADPQHYVASVEFGNEVMGGAGTTWVKHFQVDVRP